MKEQIIQLPNNFEIKEIKDGKIILVEKEKKLTYEDVAKELFANKKGFYITKHEVQEGNIIESFAKDSNNCTSRKQAEKLLAINLLMNVAKYLNDGWQPNWSNDEQMKYFIVGKGGKSDFTIRMTAKCQSSFVYFKNEKFIAKAIDILGEETIRLALCTDY